MKRAIQAHLKDFIAIMCLLVLSIATSAYILVHERLRFPLIQSAPIKMFVEMSTAQAFTPGQGQTVRISGVQVGEVGQVKLENGLALIEMDIDQKYKNVIRTNATALARPRTGLQDMMIEVNPGTKDAPPAKEGFTIPISETMPEVNLDEIEASLDTDTRAYLDLLVNGTGPALKLHGGKEIAGLLERYLPTHRDLARLNSAVAARGTNLRRLVNSLQRLNTALAADQGHIVQLVDSSSAVFQAFASENSNVSRAIADLPGTLSQTTATMAKVKAFADLLGPTANNLLPAARALPAANAALSALARPSTPIVRDQIRPFVVASRPFVRNLRPAAVNLAKATPNLGKVFVVLNHLFNYLGYNPGTAEHGYLWWLAWQDHMARTLFSIQDPNGTFRPLFVQISCAQVQNLVNGFPAAFSATVISILNLSTVQNACTSLGLTASSDKAGSSSLAKAAATKGGLAGSSSSSSSSSSSGSATQAAGSSSSTTSTSSTSTSSSSSNIISTLASAAHLSPSNSGGGR